MASLTGKNTREAVIGSASFKNVFKTVAVSTTTTLGVYERQVLVETTGAGTIALPRAEDASGLTFTITLVIDGGNLTVTYPGAAGQDPADSVLTAVDDYVSVRSSGERWILESEITT